MNVFVLNCGSSSLKYQLFNTETNELMAKGIIERIGLANSFIKHEANGKKVKNEGDFPNHAKAIQEIINRLTNTENGVIKDIKDISSVGHRVVHGGEKFTKSVVINDEVLNAIRECSPLAPLHNPANITGIESAKELIPDATHVAVFDTAFHQTIPAHGYLYALPYEWYTEHKVRRYGFHGTSHYFVSKKAMDLLEKDGIKKEDSKIVTMHIGNGASACAISGGKSIETSMGFTPLEGLVMGSRSGDIDPAIISYIAEKENLDAKGVENLLNKKSGILGITGQFTDRRDVELAAEKGDKRCELALQIEGYRIKKYIGTYMAVLGGLDAIVFTAGVGENGPITRNIALKGLEGLGIIIDKKKNNETFRGNGHIDISKPESKVRIYVIPTDEESVFIEDAIRLTKS